MSSALFDCTTLSVEGLASNSSNALLALSSAFFAFSTCCLAFFKSPAFCLSFSVHAKSMAFSSPSIDSKIAENPPRTRGAFAFLSLGSFSLSALRLVPAGSPTCARNAHLFFVPGIRTKH